MSLLHPRFETLRAFARAELDSERRPRIAAHVVRCGRCRAQVERVRAVNAIGAVDLAPPDDALPAILARRARGERVILPAADVAPRPAHQLRRIAAIALLAMATTAIVLVRARDADAGQSDLRFTPARPTAGATLSVTYNPTARLVDAHRLILRARLYTVRPGRGTRNVVLGTLDRRDGAFEGTVTLPDSVVYAVLAVEDPEGSYVDHFAESWQVLVHDTTARPLYEALHARFTDVQQRDSRIAEKISEQMAALYPARVFGWRMLFFARTRNLPEEIRDSVAAVHRTRRLHALMAGIETNGPDAFELATMVFYADEIGADSMSDRVKALLYERFPTHEATLQRRTFDLADAHRGQPEALLAAYNRMHEAYGRSGQLGYSAFSLAQREHDTTALRLWGSRFIQSDSSYRSYVATQVAEYESLRPLAASLLRAEIARYDDEPTAEPDEASPAWTLSSRPITQTREQFREARRLALGSLLTTHGTTLLALGDTAAALDTLAHAFDAGWDPARFRTIGALHLALGDTAAAAAAVARVAADPTTAAVGDTLRVRLGAAGNGEQWETAVQDARATMMREVWSRAIDRKPLLSRIRLTTLGGEATTADLATGGPLVVAFWSRYCPPSFRQLGQLDAVAARLARDGVRVIAITDESAGTAKPFVEGNGWTFPVRVDPQRDARRAFDQPGTPTYFILDGEGRIRFETHAIDEVVRFVYAVRGGGV